MGVDSTAGCRSFLTVIAHKSFMFRHFLSVLFLFSEQKVIIAKFGFNEFNVREHYYIKSYVCVCVYIYINISYIFIYLYILFIYIISYLNIITSMATFL